MTPAYARFVAVVERLHALRIPPTPTNILVALKRSTKGTGMGGPMLNGREARWRTETLVRLGYRKHPITGRWLHPDHELTQEIREYEDTH